MISFGDLKNNINQLKKYLPKMGFLNSQFSLKDLDEENLRKRKNQIFLPLYNYILLKCSNELRQKITQKVKGIRVMSDKDFVENSFVFCRNFFSIDIVLTSDQFLSEKYFDKKVELLANLTKRIYEWDQGNKKRKSKFENETKKQSEMYSLDFDDVEEEQQMKVINIKPHQLNQKKIDQKFVPKKTNKLASYLEEEEDSYYEEKPQVIKRNQPRTKANQWDLDDDDDEIEQQKEVPVKKFTREIKKQNVNIQPKQFKQMRQSKPLHKMQKVHEEEQDKMYDKYMVKQKTPIPKYPCEQKEEQYVTKQQFYQVISLVKTLTESINHNSKMFQNFQTKIQNQYEKMNARLSFMEASVKMLKDNL